MTTRNHWRKLCKEAYALKSPGATLFSIDNDEIVCRAQTIDDLRHWARSVRGGHNPHYDKELVGEYLDGVLDRAAAIDPAQSRLFVQIRLGRALEIELPIEDVRKAYLYGKRPQIEADTNVGVSDVNAN